jgi:2,4-dienoyl-CoA reductase-like NADH-dependent reductase (Old Yellow Enzyme family)
MTSTASTAAGLFQPFSVRGLTIPNRIVMSPMNRNAAPDGVPGEDIAQYYRRRVDGGVGLVVTGGICVDHPTSTGVYADRPCAIPMLNDDASKAGWKRAVDLAHEGGGKIVAQLWHLGVMRTPGTGYFPEVASARPSGIFGPSDGHTHIPPEFIARLSVPGPALTDAQILEIIEAYARTAREAVALGFDGLAVHGADGYLPDAFMWEKTNQRTDRWGGNRRERTRFATELMHALRREAGDAMPIFYRFSQWKHHDALATLADTPEELEDIVGPLADAGVDVFDAQQHNFNRPTFAGSNLNLAGWAKKITGRPSMTVGAVGLNVGLYDPNEVADTPVAAVNDLGTLAARFERGEFDLVGVGRSLLNDPAWANKARLGEPFEPYDRSSMRGVAR